jgi:hypothetical protein
MPYVDGIRRTTRTTKLIDKAIHLLHLKPAERAFQLGVSERHSRYITQLAHQRVSNHWKSNSLVKDAIALAERTLRLAKLTANIPHPPSPDADEIHNQIEELELFLNTGKTFAWDRVNHSGDQRH